MPYLVTYSDTTTVVGNDREGAVDVPTVAENYLVIIQVLNDTSMGSITFNESFTQITTTTTYRDYATLSVFYRIAASGESEIATYGFSFESSGYFLVRAITFYNVNTSSPISTYDSDSATFTNGIALSAPLIVIPSRGIGVSAHAIDIQVSDGAIDSVFDSNETFEISDIGVIGDPANGEGQLRSAMTITGNGSCGFSAYGNQESELDGAVIAFSITPRDNYSFTPITIYSSSNS